MFVMYILEYIKKNKLRVIIGLIILGVVYGAYKLSSFIFGFGLSFPPNKCDLVTGHEVRGDLILDKRSLCFYDLALEKQNPRLCRFVKHNSEGCLREIALMTGDVSVCNDIKSDYNRENCIYLFAGEEAESDINKALAICGNNDICRNKSIKDYQKANSIEGEVLVYRCLNYQVGDMVTELLCKLNTNYLVNWQGHHDLFYMYGEDYPMMGRKLCEMVASLNSSESEVSWCYQRVEGHTKEMSRVGSDFYKFLQENPGGLGEPK